MHVDSMMGGPVSGSLTASSSFKRGVYPSSADSRQQDNTSRPPEFTSTAVLYGRLTLIHRGTTNGRNETRPGFSRRRSQRTGKDSHQSTYVGFRVMLSGSTMAMLKREVCSEVWAHLALGISVQPGGGERVEFFKGSGYRLFIWNSDPLKDEFSVSRWQLKEALLHKTNTFIRLGIVRLTL